jgi:hypothetical protein
MGHPSWSCNRESRAMNVVVVIYILLFVIPGLPLLMTWHQALTRGDSFSSLPALTCRLPLFFTTASFLLFFFGLFAKSAIGPDYSDRRFMTIWSNLALAIVMLVLSLRGKKSPYRTRLATAAAAVALVWLYAWAVSAVV